MFAKCFKIVWKMYVCLAVAIFTAELFLKICSSIQIKPSIVLSLIISEPLLCSIVLLSPLILIPRKVWDRMSDNKVFVNIFAVYYFAPFIFGLISAIIDLHTYSNTHEQLMFTILGKGISFK